MFRFNSNKFCNFVLLQVEELYYPRNFHTYYDIRIWSNNLWWSVGAYDNNAFGAS